MNETPTIPSLTEQSAGIPNTGEDIKLSTEDAEAVKAETLEWYKAAQADNLTINQKISTYWDEFYQGTEYKSTTNTIMKNASNTHIPLIQWITLGLHSQITQQAFETSPFALIMPGASGDPNRAWRLESFTDYLLDEMLAYPEKADELALNALMEGGSILYVPWNERRKMMYRAIPADEKSNAVQNHILKTGKAPKPGQLPTKTLGNELVSSGPDPQVLMRSQFCVYPANSVDINKADAAFMLTEIDRNTLVNGYNNGEFPLITPEQWEKIIKDDSPSDSTSQTTLPGKTGRNQKATGSTKTKFKYAAIECYRWYDVDDDDLLEPTKVVILADSEIMIKCCLSEYGEDRPFINYNVLPPGRNLYGIPMGQMLSWAMGVLNTLINMKIDDIKIRHLVAKSIIYGSTSGFDPDAWEYGMPLMVDDVSQITTLQVPNTSIELIPMMEYIIGFIVRLTGLSDQFLGKANQGTQTATETAALVNLGSTRFQRMMDRFSIGHKEFIKFCHLLYYYFMPSDNLTYNITMDEQKQLDIKNKIIAGARAMAQQNGQDPDAVVSQVLQMIPQKGISDSQVITREDFNPFVSVKIVPQGSKGNINRDVSIRDAVMAWNMFNQDPAFLMSAPHRWELMRNVIAAMGYVVEKMCPPQPADGPAMPPPTPEPPPPPKISITLPIAPVQLPEPLVLSLLSAAGVDVQAAMQGPAGPSQAQDQNAPDAQGQLGLESLMGQGGNGVDPNNPNSGLPLLPPLGSMQNSPEELSNQLAAQSRQAGFQGG